MKIVLIIAVAGIVATILIICIECIIHIVKNEEIEIDTDKGVVNKSVSWEKRYSEQSVSWEDVKGKGLHMECCPKCGLKPHNLHWFEYDNHEGPLVGGAGFYSICPDCKIRVDDIMTKIY